MIMVNIYLWIVGSVGTCTSISPSRENTEPSGDILESNLGGGSHMNISLL